MAKSGTRHRTTLSNPSPSNPTSTGKNGQSFEKLLTLIYRVQRGWHDAIKPNNRTVGQSRSGDQKLVNQKQVKDQGTNAALMAAPRYARKASLERPHKGQIETEYRHLSRGEGGTSSFKCLLDGEVGSLIRRTQPPALRDAPPGPPDKLINTLLHFEPAPTASYQAQTPSWHWSLRPPTMASPQA